MSDFHNAETAETAEEEENTAVVDNLQNEKERECPKMHLQLTVEGDEESKATVKDYETQESPEGKGKDWKHFETQESPVSKTSKDEVDWKVRGTEEDESEHQGSVSGPPAEYISSKTVDDDLKQPVVNHRVMETVEDEDDHWEPYEAFVAHKVIWKLVEVRPHAKNTDSVSKMIHLLPVESISKGLGEWTLFGRGENVDVYLHDLVSSRKHAEFTFTSDNRKKDSHRLVATLRNKSDTKKIKVNGNKELASGEVYELRNNDQIAIGVFTFLIEIVPGDSKSKKYEVKFLNIVPLSMQSQGGLPSLYALPPGMQMNSMGMQPEYGVQSELGGAMRRMPASPLRHSDPSEGIQQPHLSPRISSPSRPPPQSHPQPVENTDVDYHEDRVAQENDENSPEDNVSSGKDRL